MQVGIRWVSLLALVLAVRPAAAQGWQPNPGYHQIPIWSGKVPNAIPLPGHEKVTKTTTSLVAGKPWTVVTNVSVPTITVYSPTAKSTRTAVLVFPGGGYEVLAMDLEGTEICEWLTSKGVTAVLVKYRVPAPKVGKYRESVQALQDAQRALSLVRFRASDLHIDPHKIGVIGFSAGGHLVAALSTRYDKRSYGSRDAIDKASCRPDFGIALYPGHLSSRYPDEPESQVKPATLALNPGITVTKRTPPTLLVQAENDPIDDVTNTLSYYLALKQARVPAELHLYAEGGHAYGLRPTSKPITQWPSLAEKWLRTIGMIP